MVHIVVAVDIEVAAVVVLAVDFLNTVDDDEVVFVVAVEKKKRRRSTCQQARQSGQTRIHRQQPLVCF